MKAGSMEGLIGACVNLKMTETPMRVYREAERRGDTAAMERAMGYVTDFQEKAHEYSDKAQEELAKELEDNHMSMEINGRYSQYQTDYAEQLKAEQLLDGAEKAKETEKGQNDEKGSDKIPVPHDEYISSEKSGAKPSGLYRVGQDEDGKRKVFFDDPKKAAEKCTGSTDKVDKEIKELKQKKKELEQQIESASGDEKKVRELEKKLTQVESELSQKDNDTYRRQHTTFTE